MPVLTAATNRRVLFHSVGVLTLLLEEAKMPAGEIANNITDLVTNGTAGTGVMNSSELAPRERTADSSGRSGYLGCPRRGGNLMEILIVWIVCFLVGKYLIRSPATQPDVPVIQFTINGMPHNVPSDRPTLTYDDICTLAGRTGTIRYFGSVSHDTFRSGTLGPRDIVAVCPGMRITCGT